MSARKRFSIFAIVAAASMSIAYADGPQPTQTLSQKSDGDVALDAVGAIGENAGTCTVADGKVLGSWALSVIPGASYENGKLNQTTGEQKAALAEYNARTGRSLKEGDPSPLGNGVLFTAPVETIQNIFTFLGTGKVSALTDYSATKYAYSPIAIAQRNNLGDNSACARTTNAMVATNDELAKRWQASWVPQDDAADPGAKYRGVAAAYAGAYR